MAAWSRVALLYGGRSGEHEVSLLSALTVAEGLAERYEVIPVLIGRDGRWTLQPGAPLPDPAGEPVFILPFPADRGRLRREADAGVLAQPDVYFPLVHGTHGEDGTLQGLLELAGVPYVGAGVAASAASMDKELMKALFARAGLPITPYRVLHRAAPVDGGRVVSELGLPLFVKPANLGSSVGITKVDAPEALPAALEAAFVYDSKLVLERAVNARELELAVMGNHDLEVAPPGEVIPDRAFYDYDSKYAADSRTRLSIPANLSTDSAEQAQALARRAFCAVGASGFARVDLFAEHEGGRLLVNEINTIPGFTAISMFPKLWEATGRSIADVVSRLVDLGLQRHEVRSALKTTYGA